MLDILIIILVSLAFYGAFITINAGLVAIIKAAYFKQKLMNQVTIKTLKGEKEEAEKLETEIRDMNNKKYFWQL